MTWTPPSGTSYLFNWQDGSSGGTPLDASNLNQQQTDEQNFILLVANSLASYIDTEIASVSGGGGGVTSITSSATPAINVATTSEYEITALATNVTSMTSGLSGTPVDGQKLLVRITDNGTPRTITWGAKFLSSGVATLLSTTAASKTHLSGFVYDSVRAVWICMAVDATGY